jgi:hypothetical protein
MLLFPLIFARRKIFVPSHPTSDVKPYPPLIDAFAVRWQLWNIFC